jgi:hypothetical protein
VVCDFSNLWIVDSSSIALVLYVSPWASHFTKMLSLSLRTLVMFKALYRHLSLGRYLNKPYVTQTGELSSMPNVSKASNSIIGEEESKGSK